MNKNKKFISARVIGIGLSGLLLSTAVLADDDDMLLISSKAASPVVIDGTIDQLWEQAKPLKIELDNTVYQPNNGYEGMTETEVTMKSLYDDSHVYFLFQYADPTHSIERFPWKQQADGSWKQSKAKDSTGHDNTYYEDKMSIFWNISAKRFDKKGCAAACHKAAKGKVNGIADISPGRKYTKPGETIDMWHWKGVRSNPNHQLDDQYVDSTSDPKLNKNWGRKGDSKTGGGYKNNVADGKPAFVAKGLNDSTVAILASEKIPFTATYSESARIPGIVTGPFEGSRGDVEALGVWKEGVWTIEIKRALVTTGKDAEIQDVQFKDLKATYPFGVSVFDNSQINHIYHWGAYDLEFK